MRYFAIILSFLALSVSAQTIRVVNNNPGAPGGLNVYTSLQAAMDSAVAGDVIHVVPSSVQHPLVYLRKQLTIIGVGLNSGKDIGTRSMVKEIIVNRTEASGSIIKGLIIETDIEFGTSSLPDQEFDNFIIENCRISRIYAGRTDQTYSNFIIRNNIFNYGNSFNFQGPHSGIIITNNVIFSFCCTNGAITGNGLTIEHNLICEDGNGYSFWEMHNSSVRKNIFYGSSSAVGDWTGATGNTFQDNLTFAYNGDTSFALGFNGNTGSGNILQKDPKFTNFELIQTWDYTYDISLQVGSAAIVDAQDRSLDIGPTGGATPWNPKGTDIPVIEGIIAPAVVKKGDNLEVRVKASGN